MKLLSLFFFCSVLLASISAQDQPVQLWQSVEYVKSIQLKLPTIAIDKYLNTYMLTNQTDERPLGGFTLVKYDTSGNLLWKRNSQPSFAGIFYGGFTVDSMGSVYVSENYDGELPGYDADAILVKYAPDGTKAWEANFGLDQSGDSYIYHSEIDTTNGRLITLGMNWHDTIPDENFLFVQAVDTADGSVVWRTEISGVFYPQNMRVQPGHIQLLSTHYRPDSKYFVNTLVDFEGNVIAQYEKPYSGYQIDFNYISKTGDVIFGNRAFGYNVTRVDVQGDTLWAYEHPLNSGTNRNRALSLDEDDSKNIYVTGSVEVAGLSNEFVSTKFDISGNVIWQNIYHSESDSLIDYGNHISIIDGKAIVSGASQFANNDIFGMIVIYDRLGGEEEYTIFVSNENVFLIDKSLGLKNKIFYIGEGYQSNINNMVAVTGCFLIPKISSSVDDVKYINAISTFTNPTADMISVSDIDTNIFYGISVCDMTGKVIMNRSIENAQEKILLSDFPSGLYIVCIYGKDLQISKKIVKI
ncbi:MAG: T9SS type A sorting domain-containing protein [Saprospiraceae bacterium]|nr:T9SS type A sorting domain-containing protein [Saprospiraceae bacterium]